MSIVLNLFICLLFQITINRVNWRVSLPWKRQDEMAQRCPFYRGAGWGYLFGTSWNSNTLRRVHFIAAKVIIYVYLCILYMLNIVRDNKSNYLFVKQYVAYKCLHFCFFYFKGLLLMNIDSNIQTWRMK